MTALHTASCNGYEAIARLLIEKGADTSAENMQGETAFQIANELGHESIVRLLRGIEPRLINSDDGSPQEQSLPAMSLNDRLNVLSLKIGVEVPANFSLIEKMGVLEEKVYGTTRDGSLGNRLRELEEECQT